MREQCSLIDIHFNRIMCVYNVVHTCLVNMTDCMLILQHAVNAMAYFYQVYC